MSFRLFGPRAVGSEGCRIGFTSEAPNLVTDASPVSGAYLGDVCAEPSSMELVSRKAEGGGCRVAFTSDATSLNEPVAPGGTVPAYVRQLAACNPAPEEDRNRRRRARAMAATAHSRSSPPPRPAAPGRA